MPVSHFVSKYIIREETINLTHSRHFGEMVHNEALANLPPSTSMYALKNRIAYPWSVC